MNNQQAINLLKGLEQSLDDYCGLNDEGKTVFHMAITALELFGNSEQLPSAQPNLQPTCNQLATDTIDRQAAIDTEGLDEQIRCEMCRNPMHTSRGCDGNCKYDKELYERIMQILDKRIKPLPSAQPYLQQTCSQLATDTIDRQAAIGAMEGVDWYHINEDGQLTHGANSREDEPLYKAEDVYKVQPVHNTGKWVRGTCYGLGIYNWTCKCGHVIAAKVPDRFCGACGCDNAERRTDD